MRLPSGWSGGALAVGCGTFGGIGGSEVLIGRGLDLDASLATLDEAVALGITMLDTAERYAGGASESMIGQWLASRDPAVTAGVQITTKVAPSYASGGDDAFDTAFITRVFRGSLERLGVDAVELLLIHAPDDATPVEDTLEAMESVREVGQAAHVGACNLDAAQLRAALHAADRLGITGYEVIQNGYSLLTIDDDLEVQAMCADRGLAYTAFSPLAGGVLTGKYRRHEPPPDGTRMALRPEGYDELLTPAVHDAIDSLRDAAGAHGVSCGGLALAWLLHHDGVAAPITGPSRSAPHLAIAAEALTVELDAGEHAEIGEWFRQARQA